jgi:peptide deformylase
MILPIYVYGHPVLKKKCVDVDKKFEGLDALIENMFETMYQANGVGLAAPQIGKAIRLFMVDTEQIFKDDDPGKGIKKIFINAQKLQEKGDEWTYEEGCLSIPHITGDVDRQAVLKIRYFDENFIEHTDVFDGINARVIQHEYDHIEGILFTDHLKPIKKRLVGRKLDALKKGKVKADYRLKFFKPIK